MMTGDVGLLGGLHDGLDLLHVVDVEGGHAVAVLGGVIEQLSQRDTGHQKSPVFDCRLNVTGGRLPVSPSMLLAGFR